MKRLVFTFNAVDASEAKARINDSYHGCGFTKENVFETMPFERQDGLDEMYEDLCMAFNGLDFDCKEVNI